jgi:hypothetical protein
VFNQVDALKIGYIENTVRSSFQFIESGEEEKASNDGHFSDSIILVQLKCR